MAVEGHDGRITVSTLAEARYFAKGGFTDILYGVGVVPSKLAAVTELRRQGVNLRVVTDNLPVAAGDRRCRQERRHLLGLHRDR